MSEHDVRETFPGCKADQTGGRISCCDFDYLAAEHFDQRDNVRRQQARSTLPSHRRAATADVNSGGEPDRTDTDCELRARGDDSEDGLAGSDANQDSFRVEPGVAPSANGRRGGSSVAARNSRYACRFSQLGGRTRNATQHVGHALWRSAYRAVALRSPKRGIRIRMSASAARKVLSNP